MRDQLVTTVDLGASLASEYLAWPQDIPTPPPLPEGTPHGYFTELWYGRTRERTEAFDEYRIWVPDGEGHRIALRVHVTEDDRLIGVFGGEIDSRGRFRAPTHPSDELALKLTEWMTGEVVGTGQDAPTPISVLKYLQESTGSTGMRFTKSAKQIQRKKMTKTVPLYLLAWKSMITASALVWRFGSDCAGALTKWRVDKGDPDERRVLDGSISVERILETWHGGTHLDWWAAQSDSERHAIACRMLQEARTIVTTPPPWKWWAGTIRRSAGFVTKNAYTGWFTPLGVRSWDNTKRSGIRTAIKRYVRPQTQATLF